MIIPAREVSYDQVAGHYDDLDGFYRRLWGDHLHHGLWTRGHETPEEAVEQLVDHVAQLAGVKRGTRVCDIGCGYGATARRLANSYGAEVTGVTISAAQFEYAHRVADGATNPRFLLENWESNEFADESFDAVISLECVSHVKDKSRYFHEIHRVLRPGGKAVVTVWLSAESPSPWQIRHLLQPICLEGRLPSMGAFTDYSALIEGAGLKRVAFEDLTAQVRKTWSVCTRRLTWQLCTSLEPWRFLLRRKSSHWVFLFSVGRILLAYRTGAMRYGLFVLETEC